MITVGEATRQYQDGLEGRRRLRTLVGEALSAADLLDDADAELAILERRMRFRFLGGDPETLPA